MIFQIMGSLFFVVGELCGKIQAACVDSLRYPLPSICEIGAKVKRWAMKAVNPTFQKTSNNCI